VQEAHSGLLSEQPNSPEALAPDNVASELRNSFFLLTDSQANINNVLNQTSWPKKDQEPKVK
jgi:hypothetical protein